MKLGTPKETPAVKRLRELHARVGEAVEPELSEALGEEDIQENPARQRQPSKAG